MHFATTIRIIAIVGGLASALMLVLNLVTDRSEFWAVWPIWAFAMIATAVIVGLRSRRVLLGFWLGGGGVLVLGLVVIDITDGSGWWAFWPAGVWLVLGALFTALTVDLLAAIPTNPSRQPDDAP